MLILISPAKTLDMDTPSRFVDVSLPQHIEQSEKLVKSLRNYSKKRLQELMNISDSLAALNQQRFKNWQPTFTQSNSRPAIQAFRGDVYVGLDADSLGKKDLKFAQQHLRILSGLYGVLKPLDLMQAYRLEMGTALNTRYGKNLYEFWGDMITESLNAELAEKGHDAMVNLASNEYFKSVKSKQLLATLVTPVFKDQKNGQYKVISFFAKKARGSMARYLIQQQADSSEAIRDFRELGYRYNKAASTAGQAVFLRTEKAAIPYLA